MRVLVDKSGSFLKRETDKIIMLFRGNAITLDEGASLLCQLGYSLDSAYAILQRT